MAKRNPPPPPQPANLSAQSIKAAIPKLERRLKEFRAINVDELAEQHGEGIGPQINSLEDKYEDTLISVFGSDSIEYDRYQVGTFGPMVIRFDGPAPLYEKVETYKKGIARAIGNLETAIELLNEQLEDMGETPGGRAVQAWDGLDLHPEIERRVGQLYRDGHYSNAVESAVKALNGLVRFRSDVEDLDGSKLMEHVFSLKNPVLSFNDLTDQSGKDEQRGFMMLFSGAVAGLRNPRSHEFIEDDPERALEFIAFISLLAKLLDEAK